MASFWVIWHLGKCDVETKSVVRFPACSTLVDIVFSRPKQAPQQRGAPYKFPVVIKVMAQDRAQFIGKLLSGITVDPGEAYPDTQRLLKHIEGAQYPWSETWYPVYSASAPFISTDYE